MRILLYGNTNNLPMQYARALRNAGHAAELIYNNSAPLHNPRSALPRFRLRTPRWIISHSHLTEADFINDTPGLQRAIGAVAGRYEFAFVTDLGLSIAERLGCPYAVLSAGSDISYYANPNLIHWRSATWSDQFREDPTGQAELARIAAFVDRQRRGIAGAAFVIIGPRGHHPAGDAVLAELGVGDERRHYPEAADTVEIPYRPLRPTLPLRVTSGARIDFLPREGTSELDRKGTDVLIEGFARAAAQSDLELHLPRKGHDVSAAERLVGQLGIGSRVSWFAERPRRGYLRLISDSVVVCDSLGVSGPAGVTLDGLAAGRIVLGNLQPEIFGEMIGAPYPGISATDPDEVAQGLTRVFEQRDSLDEWSREARRFAVERLSLEAHTRRLLNRIQTEALGGR